MRCRSASSATASRAKSTCPNISRSLRRRFLQNQEDCTFTIMALLPTLSTQIFQEMDVEATRQELKQVIDSAKEAPKVAPAPEPAPAPAAWRSR